MKLTKILISGFLALNLLPSLAKDNIPDFKKNEQVQEQTLQSIKEIVIFNASIIGYSKFCKSGDDKAKSVLAHFNNIMRTLNLNEDDSKKLENDFIRVMEEAASGKNLPNGFQCSIFNNNFNEIYNYIQTGKK